MFVGKLLYPVLSLHVFQVRLVHRINQVNFIETQDYGNGPAIHAQYLVDLLFPLCGVFDRLRARDVGYHDHTLRLAAKVSIQAFVARVHAYEVPDFKSHLVALHPQQLELVVRPDRCLAVLLEAITNEPVHNRCLTNAGVAQHDYLEGKCHISFYIKTTFATNYKNYLLLINLCLLRMVQASSDEHLEEPPMTRLTEALQSDRVPRPSLMTNESNKLPLHLCRVPNRKIMSDAEFEDSFREMIENRLYLDNVEREAFGKVVKQGVPENLRGKFWNLCTGIHMY